jgi:hypothetical protein
MGYYIDLTDADWWIPETTDVLQALKEMPTKYHAIKRGGSSNGEAWFSWMSDESILNANTAESIFNDLGFETTSTDGGFKLEGYNSKTGQEDLFLAVVAPFCPEGAYVEFRGEDGAEWQYSVRGGVMHYAEVTKKFDDPHPWRYTHFQFDDNKTQSFAIDITQPLPSEVHNGHDKYKKVEA